MKKFILANDDFSSIENIGNKFIIDDITYYKSDDCLIIKLQTPIYRYITEYEFEYIISNKNRFVIIDDDGINYCCESKKEFYYNHCGIFYDLYLEDAKLDEMDENSVNILKLILC